MANVAVILAGCGYLDGAEVHEAVCTLLYLDKRGAKMSYFAPDTAQRDVVNHNTSTAEGEGRNVLIESARISRGNIEPVSKLDISQFDAVIFPGGFGAAKNLCSFAVDGPNCEIDTYVDAIIKNAHKQKKVIGALCIAPVVIARALKDSGANPKLTIGTDPGTMDALKELNADPQEAQVTEIVVDEANKIVSTPAYMLGPNIAKVAEGIEKLVNKVLEMC